LNAGALNSITSLGNLSAITVTGNIAGRTLTITEGAVIGENLTVTGNITSNALSTVNANVGALVVSGSLSATGAITALSISATNLSVPGTITGGIFSGTLGSGTLNNITALGSLTALTVSGNVTTRVLSVTTGAEVGNGLTVTGNITSNQLSTVTATIGNLSIPAGAFIGLPGANPANGILTVTNTISGHYGNFDNLYVNGTITGGTFSGTFTGNFPGVLNISDTAAMLGGNVRSSILTATGYVHYGEAVKYLDLTGGNVGFGIMRDPLSNTGTRLPYITAETVAVGGLSATGEIDAQSLSVTSGAAVGGDFTVTGSILSAGITVSGSIYAGALTTSGGLFVGGGATVGSGLSVTGTVRAAGITVSGGITAGAITSTGQVSAGAAGIISAGGLTVTGTIKASGVTVSGSIYAGAISTSGGVIVGGDLTVLGSVNAPNLNITSLGNLTQITVSNNVTTANLSVTNTALINNLTVSGDVNINSTVSSGTGKIILGNSNAASVVGIGGTPSGTYKLEIFGNLKSTSINETSDIRYKKNIRPLTGSLNKVLALQGVNYLWRTDEFPGKGFDTSLQMGVIAQQVESIVPEVVRTDEKGFKSVEYSKLVALLIEAVKEQQKIIDEQKSDLNKLKSDSGKIEKLEADMANMKLLLEGLNKTAKPAKTKK